MRFGILLFLCCVVVPVARAEPIRVAAAVSLKEAVERVADVYRAETGNALSLSFGSSGQIMGQVRGGAPIDAFISASHSQVDRLMEEGLIDPTTRRIVATNQLIVIVPAKSEAAPGALSDLLEARYKRIALGEPQTVPAGQYAAQALKATGLLEALEARIIHGSSVRQVLSYVARGEVDAGIVYRTDALEAGEQVKVAARVDTSLHDLIEYPAAVVAGSRRRQTASDFLDFLGTPAAQQILRDKGFGIPTAAPAATPATAPLHE